ncbi:50S ribosomal protein L3 N(5)-glutamine methyltransferase [Alteromonas facilis]|uniref:50S ribosomal protein L3 N(5)-glutamine methyltransferase n=1 Tax=Alteromonas facilis TaxID=2048004 RepID=UPI000C291387|nr:50S ribosomal protein L3 N(5)-glutamine methyltransferase [Alteromonas facilis]
MTDKIYLDQAINDLESILDLVRWSVSRFNDADLFFGHGTDNAWDEAVTLVMFALHLPQDLTEYTGDALFNARLTHSERQKIAELVLKRVQTRLPLPYLTNQAWFCGLPFYVDERVLIPRSPFAELIQKQFAEHVNNPAAILDLCTGGGCIAIALAHAFPEAEVDALDISPDAIDVANINIQEHGLEGRVVAMQSDVYSALQHQRYDLIVSNPPYVDAEDMADLPAEFQHEPELALASGNDGLDLVDQIIAQSAQHLTDNGWLFVEVGNSLVHFSERFPGLEIEWITLENGGDGIFAVSRDALLRYTKG